MYFWKNTILNFSHVGGSLNCFANYGTISSLTWINGNLCIVLLFFSPSIFSPTLKQNTPTLGNDFAERKNSVTSPVQRKNGGMFTFHWNSSNWFFSVPLALYWQGKIFFFFQHLLKELNKCVCNFSFNFTIEWSGTGNGQAQEV